MKEWLLNILSEISMPHFYSAKSFKKTHANSWEETQSGYISFQTLHLSSLHEKVATVDAIYAEREEPGVSSESVVKLFVLLGSCIIFFGGYR